MQKQDGGQAPGPLESGRGLDRPPRTDRELSLSVVSPGGLLRDGVMATSDLAGRNTAPPPLVDARDPTAWTSVRPNARGPGP